MRRRLQSLHFCGMPLVCERMLEQLLRLAGSTGTFALRVHIPLPFTCTSCAPVAFRCQIGTSQDSCSDFVSLQVTQGAATLGWSLARFLTALKDAGLGSLPGTAAEVLHDDVRQTLCPDKLTTASWLQVSCGMFQQAGQQLWA